MRAEVRDDIISLDTFVDARFKYEKYIDIIHECGGYCFLDQFEKLWKEEGGRYLAKKMENTGLIKIKSYSNYSYVHLSDAALKYLIYKDSPRDFSDKEKNLIPVKKLNPKPSDKVLFFSSTKFHLINSHKNYCFLKKSQFIKSTRQEFKSFLDASEDKNKQIKEKVQLLSDEKNNLGRIYNTYLKGIDSLFDYNNLQEKLHDIDTQIDLKEKEIENKLFGGNSKEKELLTSLKNQKSNIQDKISIALEINKDTNKLKRPYFDKEKKIKQLQETLEKMEIKQEKANEKIEALMKKVLNLHDKSKLILRFKNENDAGVVIQLVIVDTGSLSSAQKYWKILYDFINDLDLAYSSQLKQLDIIFITFDKVNRIKYYEKIFDGIQKSSLSREALVAKKIINIDYMEKYKQNVQGNISYIKEKDLDNFEKLREKIEINDKNSKSTSKKPV